MKKWLKISVAFLTLLCLLGCGYQNITVSETDPDIKYMMTYNQFIEIKGKDWVAKDSLADTPNIAYQYSESVFGYDADVYYTFNPKNLIEVSYVIEAEDKEDAYQTVVSAFERDYEKQEGFYCEQKNDENTSFGVKGDGFWIYIDCSLTETGVSVRCSFQS